MLDKLLTGWPLYNEIFAKGYEEGLRLSEGMDVQQGRLKCIRTLIVRFVKRRFVALAEEAETHLLTIEDLTQLQAMVDEISFVPDEAAARALLGLPA